VLKRNIVANYVGTSWNAIMNIAFVPVYVKYLGTEAYGVVGISTVIATFFAFFDFGLSPMLGREVARYRGGSHSAESIRSLLRVVELSAWSVGILGALLVWRTAPWIASGWLRSETLSTETIAHAIRIMALVVCLRFVEGMYRGVLNGLQKQVTVNVIGSFAATLRGLGSIVVLAWWSPTLDTFFWWQGAVAVIATTLFAIFSHKAVPRAVVNLKLGIHTLTATWPFAHGILIGNLIGLGLGQADKVVLSRVLELSEYGEYMLTTTIASCVPMAVAPIGQAMYPRLTERHPMQDKEELVADFHRMAQLVTVVAGGVGTVLVVFSHEILLVWTGDLRITFAATTPLRLLGIAAILSACAQVLDYLQLAAGRTRLRNTLNGLAVLAVVPALVLAVPRYGMNGAAAVWLGLSVLYISVYAPLSLRDLMRRELWRWAVRDLAVPLIAALSTGLVIHAACQPLPTRPVVCSAILATTGVLCVTTAALAAPVVREGAFRAIRKAAGASEIPR
jgi:O-antigen/teichoic acid export membrane protein